MKLDPPPAALLASGQFPERDPSTLPLLDSPADGIPPVISTRAALDNAVASLREGHGPVAVDAERASGFRYGQRAFLVQLRRAGAGTFLIDPEAFDDLLDVNEALADAEWILHAAHQDLPCLRELELQPNKLFDTELAARLAGLPRVGLAYVTETMLGVRLAKEHSAADWSVRPLPQDWLNYATLDVEVLIELRDQLEMLLRGQKKWEMALEEFEYERLKPGPQPKKDPWRRTHGLHQLKDKHQILAVKELWEEREKVAQNKDRAPGRLLPDSAIIAAARNLPATVPALLRTEGFRGRLASKEARRWVTAIARARNATRFPPRTARRSTMPPPRSWNDRFPDAAERYQTARWRLERDADALGMPLENLLAPATLKEISWQPPEELTLDSVSERLRELHAREWQVRRTAAVITVAFLEPEPLADAS